ncbi:hypothetical protein ACL9RF_17625, partial [Sphingobacterium sp. Mn56C]|uniref:hypothetical protein n=1 Tax=Sphingobacterium sp. Mn56C TaxID=3395261 RepID=UPI003BBD6BFB
RGIVDNNRNLIGGKQILYGDNAAKGGTKLLNQFNSAESLIQGAQSTFGKALKHGELQGFVKGNADAIFKSITNGGTALPSGAMQMSNGNIIRMYNATSTGAPTIFINTPSQIYKIRITP